MKFSFDSASKQMLWQILRKFMSMKNLHIKKGERLANFELGLTIVMLSENDATKFKLFENKELKFSAATELIK